MATDIADELTEGERCQQAGDLAGARDHFCAVLRQQPTHPRAWHLLGVTAYRAGESALALECLERAWSGNRDDADFHRDLARAQRAAGDSKSASASLREAARLRPDDPDPWTELGEVLLYSCLTDEAREALREALDRDPDHVPALVQMTSLLLTLGEQEAEETARRAVRLRTDLARVHHDLGVALMEQGRLEEAEPSYRQALLLNPDFPDALNHLGILLQKQNRLEEALRCYAATERFWPDRAEVFNNIGGILLTMGRTAEAIPHFEQALRRQPSRAEILTNLGMALLLRGRVEEAMTHHRLARRLPDIPPGSHEMLLLAANFDPDLDPGCLLEEHVRWAKMHTPRVAPAPHANDPAPDRPLRVGYVSPDLRGHAVARFFEPVLAGHDPRRVEAYCYAEVPDPDGVTRRLRALARGWRFTCGLGDAAVADLVRADRIDILVDLAGHTAGNRLPVFALRPAPVQATYLGYPNTTGLAAIDYRLTDQAADPPGGPPRYTEELVYLSEGFCCFALPPEAPEVGPLPALRNGHLTFASPHDLPMLNGHVLDLWARVLGAVPGSRLLVFRGGLDEAVRERLTEEFARRGIEAGRLDLRDVRTDMRGYLGLYGEVDICLDAFPVAAHTTACEALCMGVPLVTLYGDRTWGRLSASILTRLGMADWVARAPEDYVAIAARWCADLPGLADVRAGLRGRLVAGLGDRPRFTRALEDAYRTLWRRWCDSRR